VDAPVSFLAHWYYALPNYVLAALMYSLLARFILSFFMAPDSTNYIFRFFVLVTDPVVHVVGWLTPRAVPPLLLVLFSAVWMLMIRFVFFLAMARAGLAPTVSG
jgi:uncharacterized protein YggT (Ycf19 family)